MTRSRSWAVIALLMVLGCPFALAHHSAAVNYDLEAEIVHENVAVVAWRFVNPHSVLVFRAPDASGKMTEWSASTRSVQHLRRNGYGPDTFKPGQIVTVVGAPGRNGQPIMELEHVELSDGTLVDFSETALASTVAPTAEYAVEPADNSGLTGVWQFVRGPVPDEMRAMAPPDAYFITVFGQAPDLPEGESGDIPLTAKGRAFQANWKPSDGECRPPSPWMGFTAPYLLEFEEQRGDRIHIRYEYMDLERTIWLDGRDHPPVHLVPRTLEGHSIGRWQGDTLVIETTNMFSNLITRNGIYHTENAAITERISRNGDTLTVVRVLNDLEHFTRPIASVVQKTLAQDNAVIGFGNCVPQQ